MCFLCIDVLDYELNRYDKIKSQIVNTPKDMKTSKLPTMSKLPVPRSAPGVSKIARSQIPISASNSNDNRRHSASYDNSKQNLKS